MLSGCLRGSLRAVAHFGRSSAANSASKNLPICSDIVTSSDLCQPDKLYSDPITPPLLSTTQQSPQIIVISKLGHPNSALNPRNHTRSIGIFEGSSWLNHLSEKRVTNLVQNSICPTSDFKLLSCGIMAENRYACDYARLGTSSCKKCKQKLPKQSLRIAKVVSNPFGDDGGDMKQYHHAACVFETFIRARATTKIITDLEDLEGHDKLTDEDRDLINRLISETMAKKGSPKKKATPKKAAPKPSPGGPSPVPTAVAASPSKQTKPSPGPSMPIAGGSGSPNGSGGGSSGVSDDPEVEKDNSFRQFRRLCADIAEENSYTGKSQIVSTYLKKGNSGNGFRGDVYLLLKLLLPGFVKTVYNINSKQLAKIFSQVFGASLTEMQEDLEQGDVAETVKTFFEASTRCPPLKKSTLSIQQVDTLLTELAKYTKEDDQQTVLTMMAKRSTANDLKMIVRLIKRDLRINAGAKHVLEALDENAYDAFQASRDLRDVVDRWLEMKSAKPGMSKKLSVRANLMTPILPMLAEACKSVDFAFKRCPNGMYAEIKYDGERVQVHKQGDNFSYFSRSLKPVLPHKVNHFKDFIPKAFQNGNDLILDAEVLLIDTKTSKPLPFGTLGVHKKSAFQDANVCLFIFDCLHYNGQNLMDKPIKDRRKFLQKNMVEVPNRILFSEMTHITEHADLKDLIMKVIREGLEGLVLKDVNSVYEPGKRHWLKVKKDYLADGAMADTADLVVIGAYFGTGNKGGMKSIFLMGCHNPETGKWCTVSKCGSGFDDAQLAKLQDQFDMVKVGRDYTQVPHWLNINRNVMPDFLVKDPTKSSVWEITGAEFSKSDSHTAAGISIRFPRCTKMRDDKTWKEATNLQELKALFKASKETADMPDMLGGVASRAAGGKWKKKQVETIAIDDDDDDSNQSNSNGSNNSSPVKTPQKRKLPPTLVSSPKKVKTEAKTICQYGANCYQKNPEHREQYSHEETKVKSEGDEHLPDVFRGMRFFLPKDVEDYDTLHRYIIAFDGDVLHDSDDAEVTHKIVKHSEDMKSNNDVPVSWVLRCIKKKKIVPLAPARS